MPCNGVILERDLTPRCTPFTRCGENEETSPETCLLLHEIGDLVSRQEVSSDTWDVAFHGTVLKVLLTLLTGSTNWHSFLETG